MNAVNKLKTIAVHKRPPRRSRGDIMRSCNTGFVDAYKTKTEAIGQSLQDRKDSMKNYSGNYAKAFGKKT